MIERENVYQIGRIEKPHGLHGELAFSYTSDVFDEVEVPYFICEIDGILVPFFIENYRFKGNDTCLVKFEGIDDEKSSRFLIKAPLFIEKKFLDDEVSGAEIEGGQYYLGFKVYDEENYEIGTIEAVDDSTENILFLVVSDEEEEFYIPAVDEYIIAIDDEAKAIQVELPEGLLEMNG